MVIYITKCSKSDYENGTFKMRWQSVDDSLKKRLCRHVGKPTTYKSAINEKGQSAEKTFKTKKFICWYSSIFEINEFYHTFGTPGIWFHGYLPIQDFGNPEFLYYNEKFGYYDFQIKDTKHLNQMFDVMKKINEELASLD